MARVYKNIQEDKNAYAGAGFDIMPIELTGGNIVVFKDIEIPFDDDLVQGLIRQYDSQDWQDNALPRFGKYYDSIGYHFAEIASDETAEKVKRLILDETTQKRLSTWRLEMDFVDGYLRISPFDVTFPYSFYACSLLDKYASDIIESMKENGLIKEDELDA